NGNADEVISQLKDKRYKVRKDGDNYLLEKGKLSRWGPYINHTGLIILLIGSMLRFFPGMYVDEIVYLNEGETKDLPTTDGQYYVKNDGFIMDTHDESSGEVFEDSLNQGNNIVSN